MNNTGDVWVSGTDNPLLKLLYLVLVVIHILDYKIHLAERNKPRTISQSNHFINSGYNRNGLIIKTQQPIRSEYPASTLDVNELTITDKIIHSGDTNTAIRFPANDTVG